jgi:hypothetical protein
MCAGFVDLRLLSSKTKYAGVYTMMQPLMYPIYMPFLTSIVMIIVGWSSQKAKTGSTLPCAS